MRNRGIGALVLSAGVMLAGASSAEAQVYRGGYGGQQVFVGAGGPVSLTPGYVDSSSYAAPVSMPLYSPPYSYYAVPPSVAARTYVGPPEFPFYGRPYGHAYDHWTWPYINGGPNADLARYYYPPLQ